MHQAQFYYTAHFHLLSKSTKKKKKKYPPKLDFFSPPNGNASWNQTTSWDVKRYFSPNCEEERCKVFQ